VISFAVAAADWVGLVHPEITPPSNFHHLRDTTGYHARSRIEANPLMVCGQTIAGQWMRCLKAFGERIAARHPDSQTAEIQIRVALINRFNALGTAEIVRVA
jgi:hypothetical protein